MSKPSAAIGTNRDFLISYFSRANVLDILRHPILVLNKSTLDHFSDRVEGNLPSINKEAARRRKRKAAAHALREKREVRAQRKLQASKQEAAKE